MKEKIPQTENEKNELRIKIMQSFEGWMNFQIVEFLEWITDWNKRKAKVRGDSCQTIRDAIKFDKK